MKPKDPPKYNSICQKCMLSCKQLDNVLLITCPNFVAKPVQMEIDFKKLSRIPRK